MDKNPFSEMNMFFLFPPLGFSKESNSLLDLFFAGGLSKWKLRSEERRAGVSGRGQREK